MLFSQSSFAKNFKKNIARIILFSHVFMTLEPTYANILNTSHDISSFHFNESVTDIRINREKAEAPWLMDMLFMDREHNERVDSEGKEQIFEPRCDDHPFFYAHENDPSTLQQGYASDADENEDVGETIQSILSQEGTAHYTRFEQHKLREGLGDLKYTDIQEIFEGTTSIGCMYKLEDIGRLALFWNGDAQLDGSEYAHIPSQKSLKLNLPGTRLHIFNTNLKDLWVEGADVSFSRKNTFERLIFKSEDDQKHGVIFNEGSSTHLQYLSTDHAVVNRGNMRVSANGSLSLKDLFLNQGTLRGDDDIVIRGDKTTQTSLSFFQNEGKMRAKSIKIRAESFYNKGIVTTNDRISIKAKNLAKNTGEIHSHEVIFKKIKSDAPYKLSLVNKGRIQGKTGTILLEGIHNLTHIEKGEEKSAVISFSEDTTLQRYINFHNEGSASFAQAGSNCLYWNTLENQGTLDFTGASSWIHAEKFSNKGIVSSKGNIQIASGVNHGTMSVDNYLTLKSKNSTPHFVNKGVTLAHALHGQGTFDNEGSFELKSKGNIFSQGTLSVEHFVNHGTFKASNILVKAGQKTFINEDDGHLTVNNWNEINAETPQSLSFINRGSIKANNFRVSRQLFQNEDHIEVKNLQGGLETWINAQGADLNVTDTTTLTAKKFEQHGELILKGDADLTIGTTTNTGVLHAHKKLKLRGEDCVNKGEIRIQESDILMKHQLINHKNYQSLKGNNKGYHIFNAGTFMLGGALNHAFPVSKNTKGRAPFNTDYKHMTLDNKGLIVQVSKADVSLNSPVKIQGKHVKNDGDMSVDHVDLKSQYFVNNGNFYVGHGTQGTVKNLTQNGKLILKGDADLNIHAIKNSGVLHAHKRFKLRGDDFVNTGEIRIQESDVLMKHQLINHKNYQSLKGDNKGYHIFNAGTFMLGGALNHAFPLYKNTKGFVTPQADYKHHTLENWGLVMRLPNSENKNSTPSRVNGATIKNYGDCVGDHMTFTAKTMENKGFIHARKSMHGTLDCVINTGDMIVGTKDENESAWSITHQKSYELTINHLYNHGTFHVEKLDRDTNIRFKTIYNYKNLAFASRQARIYIQDTFENRGDVLIDLNHGFYPHRIENKKNMYFKSADMKCFEFVNAPSGVLHLHKFGNFFRPWDIYAGTQPKNKIPYLHNQQLKIENLVQNGHIQSESSLNVYGEKYKNTWYLLSSGTWDIENFSYIYFPSRYLIDGQDLLNISQKWKTKYGIHIHGANLDLQYADRFHDPRTFYFHLTQNANIYGDHYFGGLHIKTPSYISITAKLALMYGGLDLEGHSITMNAWDTYSKGTIKLNASHDITLGSKKVDFKKLISDQDITLKSGHNITLERAFVYAKGNFFTENPGVFTQKSSTIYSKKGVHFTKMREAIMDVYPLVANKIPYGVSEIQTEGNFNFNGVKFKNIGGQITCGNNLTSLGRRYEEENVSYSETITTSVQKTRSVQKSSKSWRRGGTKWVDEPYSENVQSIKTTTLAYPKKIVGGYIQIDASHIDLRGFTSAGRVGIHATNIRGVNTAVHRDHHRGTYKMTLLVDVKDYIDENPSPFAHVDASGRVQQDSFLRTPNAPQTPLSTGPRNPKSIDPLKGINTEPTLQRAYAQCAGRLPSLHESASLAAHLFNQSNHFASQHGRAFVRPLDIEQIEHSILYYTDKTNAAGDVERRLTLAIPLCEINTRQSPGDIYSDTVMDFISQGDIEFENMRLTSQGKMTIKGEGNVTLKTGKYTVCYGSGNTVTYEEKAYPIMTLESLKDDTDIEAGDNLHTRSIDITAQKSIHLETKRGDILQDNLILTKTSTTETRSKKHTETTTHKKQSTAGSNMHALEVDVITKSSHDHTIKGAMDINANRDIHFKNKGKTTIKPDILQEIKNTTGTSKKRGMFGSSEKHNASNSNTPSVSPENLTSNKKINFEGDEARATATHIKTHTLVNNTKKGLTLDAAKATATQSQSSTTRTLFGAVKSVWDAGRDILFPTTVEVDEAHTTSSPLHMDSVTENPVSQKPITFHGEYTRTHTALNHLRSWSTSSTKASGMFNPKIAAVVALGMGLATQGWGSALSGSLGLTGASAAALSAGVSAVCTHVGVQTLQNNGDIKTSVKDMSRTRALMNVLEAMATAGVTSGVSGGLSGVSAHAARAGVKEAVHTGVAAAQGQKSAPKDIFARFMTATFAALSAESVGKIYAAGEVDPIIHKLLHGGIGAASGGILGGKDGAISGASAAVVAETLADIMRPQVEAALTEIAQRADSAESYHTQAEDYLGTQHNLILLTSVAITASLGGDVDQATFAADNALKNNAMKTLLTTTAGVIWEIVQIIHEDEIASGKDAVVNYVAKKTGVDKETVAASFDVVALGLSTGNAVKQGVKGVVKAGVKAATATKTPKQHVGSSQPISKPDTLPAFPDAKKADKKTHYPGGKRTRWKDRKYIYEWDSQHGTVEKYSKKGKHIGEFDAQTGAQLKPANKTRRIEP